MIRTGVNLSDEGSGQSPRTPPDLFADRDHQRLAQARQAVLGERGDGIHGTSSRVEQAGLPCSQSHELPVDPSGDRVHLEPEED